MLEAIFKYSFLQNALLSALFASIICGIIGVIISEKKLLMMSGGIAHTAYGGVGLGYLCGFEPIIGAGAFALISSFIIGKIRRTKSRNSDIIISLLWAMGMSLGVLFTELMPGYPPDMNSYLFGNILSVTKSDLYTVIILSLIVVLIIALFFNDWKAYLFDECFSEIRGIKTYVLEYLLLAVIALSIVALIRVAGIILIIALLSAPAACASLFSKTLKGRMIIAVILSIVFCVSGITVSYYMGFSSGTVIVFIAVLSYFVLSVFKKR